MNDGLLTKRIFEAMQVPALSERHDAIRELMRLYAESVIGEDDLPISVSPLRYSQTAKNLRNELRAEQRARIK